MTGLNDTSYQRGYYKKNKKIILKKQSKYRKNFSVITRETERKRKKRMLMRDDVIKHLRGRSCEVCGYDKDPTAFVVDRVTGNEWKRANILSMWYDLNKKKRYSRKIFKVLCANCNQIKQKRVIA